MIANINNFGVVNFYENGSSNSKKEQAQPTNIEEITPVEESAPVEKTTSKKEQAYTTPIPRKGDYNGVRMYIEERKRYDPQFKDYCLHHNRKELCTLLTKEFGWFVDDKSLGKNISRNI
jgi:hypothetical protein